MLYQESLSDMEQEFMPLNIQDKPLGEMRSHGEETFPNECCGFFLGEENSDARIVTQAIRIENIKKGDQRRRFEISGKDYIQVEKYAALKGLTLLGIYHSHPVHPAIPSEHDLKVAMPWFSYIIISVEKEGVDHLRSWQLTHERKFKEEIII